MTGQRRVGRQSEEPLATSGEPVAPAATDESGQTLAASADRRGDGESEALTFTRRGVLAWLVVGVGGGVVAALAAVDLPPLVAPAFRRNGAPWARIGPIAAAAAGVDLTVEDTAVAATFTRTVRDAFMPPSRQTTRVFVVNRGNGEFVVFDARCTHLGCPLYYDNDTHEFYCPCHGGVFDLRGSVKDGPPPRPLDRYQWKVQDGVLYVGALQHE